MKKLTRMALTTALTTVIVGVCIGSLATPATAATMSPTRAASTSASTLASAAPVTPAPTPGEVTTTECSYFNQDCGGIGMWEHSNYGGRYAGAGVYFCTGGQKCPPTVRDMATSMGSFWQDRISSICNTTSQDYLLFTDNEYRGSSMILWRNDWRSSLAWPFNDSISSFRPKY